MRLLRITEKFVQTQNTKLLTEMAEMQLTFTKSQFIINSQGKDRENMNIYQKFLLDTIIYEKVFIHDDGNEQLSGSMTNFEGEKMKFFVLKNGWSDVLIGLQTKEKDVSVWPSNKNHKKLFWETIKLPEEVRIPGKFYKIRRKFREN